MYIGNITYLDTGEAISEIDELVKGTAAPYIHLEIHREGGSRKTYACADFDTKDQAGAAIRKVHGVNFLNRHLVCRES